VNIIHKSIEIITIKCLRIIYIYRSYGWGLGVHHVEGNLILLKTLKLKTVPKIKFRFPGVSNIWIISGN